MTSITPKTEVGQASVWLPLNKLHKWEADCQRNLTNLQREIANNFRQDSLGVIHVMRRNGKYLVIDGQNRCAGMRLKGFNGTHLVPCIDHGTISDAEAAKVFRAVNNFKSLKPVNIFLAAYMGGDPDHIAIVDILSSEGLRVGEGSDNGVIRCVQALLWLHRPRKDRDPEAEALHRTIKSIVTAWGPTPAATNQCIVKGIGAIYLRDKDRINDEEMVAHLGPRPGGPAKLLGDARGLRDMLRGAVSDCVSELVVQEYNRGRRSADYMLKPFRS